MVIKMNNILMQYFKIRINAEKIRDEQSAPLALLAPGAPTDQSAALLGAFWAGVGPPRRRGRQPGGGWALWTCLSSAPGGARKPLQTSLYMSMYMFVCFELVFLGNLLREGDMQTKHEHKGQEHERLQWKSRFETPL